MIQPISRLQWKYKLKSAYSYNRTSLSMWVVSILFSIIAIVFMVIFKLSFLAIALNGANIITSILFTFKHKLAPILAVVANMIWLVYIFDTNNYELIPMLVVYMVVNGMGVFVWFK